MPSHRLLAMCCLGLGLLAGCGSGPAQTAPGAAPPIASIGAATAALVATGSLEHLPGTVRAARAATLMARVAGVVSSIAVTPGTQVAAGDVLVALDAQELAARRDQAQATAAQAAADLERARLISAREAMTRAELDAAVARAAATAAAATEAAVMASYARIAAPFAGVVVRKHAEVGDLVAPGRPVIDLEDPASLRLVVAVPESLSGRIALGDALPVQIPAAGIDAVAAVAEITPAADPVSRSVRVELALPAAAGLRSGQFGRVALATAAGASLAVPAAAVVRRGQLDAVFVIDGGRARLRLVRPGGEQDGRILIRAGLAEGETVATDGADRLRDGQPVAVR